MLASSEVMDALKTIGLNLYERKLWVALLAKGVATAGELSSVANVPSGPSRLQGHFLISQTQRLS